MSEYQKLIELEQQIKNKFNETYGPTESISIEIVDTVYYRTFELRDFFELNEHTFIELGSVEFLIEIKSGRTVLFSCRISSCNLEPSIAVINVNSYDYIFGSLFLNVLNILLPSLQFKVNLFVGVTSVVFHEALAEQGYKEVQKYTTGRSNNIILSKLTNDK